MAACPMPFHVSPAVRNRKAAGQTVCGSQCAATAMGRFGS
jgi:hypothetical protein